MSHPTAPRPSASLVCAGLGFSWPDGQPLLRDFDLVVGPGRTGLIGLNGSGKSTLLRLIAGELRPDAGTVKVTGDLGHLRQNLVLDTALRVDEALGIGDTRAALHAIEAGRRQRGELRPRRRRLGRRGTGPRHARPARPGQVGLDRHDRRGVRRRVGAAAAWPRCCCAARTSCCSTSRPTTSTCTRGSACTRPSRPGRASMVVVSHDRELLDLVDQIAELRAGEVALVRRQLSAPTRRRSPSSRRPPSGWCAPPRPTCAARSANWPTPRSSWPGGSGTGRRCTTTSASRRSSMSEPQAAGPGVRGQAPHPARGERLDEAKERLATRPRRRYATTTRSASTCRTRRCPPGASVLTLRELRAPLRRARGGRLSTCAGRSGSR